MAYTWKSDTAEAIPDTSNLGSDSGAEKAGMYGLVNNLNYIVETVNSTADAKAASCTRVSESTRWAVQFETTRTAPSNSSVSFCSSEVATESDFNTFRSDAASVRNNIGTDSSIYCSTAKTPNYTSDESSHLNTDNSNKSNCPVHNSPVYNSRNA